MDVFLDVSYLCADIGHNLLRSLRLKYSNRSTRLLSGISAMQFHSNRAALNVSGSYGTSLSRQCTTLRVFLSLWTISASVNRARHWIAGEGRLRRTTFMTSLDMRRFVEYIERLQPRHHVFQREIDLIQLSFSFSKNQDREAL